jgi:hypothetical protein
LENFGQSHLCSTRAVVRAVVSLSVHSLGDGLVLAQGLQEFLELSLDDERRRIIL